MTMSFYFSLKRVAMDIVVSSSVIIMDLIRFSKKVLNCSGKRSLSTLYKKQPICSWFIPLIMLIVKKFNYRNKCSMILYPTDECEIETTTAIVKTNSSAGHNGPSLDIRKTVAHNFVKPLSHTINC